ncbi:hypothetical protein QR685DRAFT_568358 [Neurospora intermedia]|uniref:Uncharacterized protein n=1 Tax=Neurospora intermedia TaxID=5142 RepID=A0ABR3DSF2_NEUIN
MGPNGSSLCLTPFPSSRIRERTAWLSSGPVKRKPGRHPGKFLGSLGSYNGTLPAGSSSVLPSQVLSSIPLAARVRSPVPNLLDRFLS